MTACASPADEILADLAEIQRLGRAIRPLSRTDPHAFCEDKDALDRKVDRLMTRFRARFGGTPSKFGTGTILGPKGRLVKVERRRRA